MLRLQARELRDHPWRTAITVTMIAVSSALVVAVLGLVTSIDASADNLSAEVAGTADVEVVASFSTATLDDQLLQDVEQTRGVAAAAPIVEAPVEIGGERALLLGGDARSLAFLPDGVASAFGEGLGNDGRGGADLDVDPGTGGPLVVLSGGLADTLDAGNGATIAARGQDGSQDLTVAGVLPEEASAADLVLTDLAAASDLRGSEGFSRILVDIDASAVDGGDDRALAVLEDALEGRAVLLDPDARVDNVNTALAPVIRTLALLAGLGVTVAGVLVFNIVSLSVSERRRHLAVTRALGARRWRLWRALLAEAGLLGLVGGVLGAVGGRLITTALIDQLPSGVVSSALPTDITPTVPPLVLLIGLAVGLLAAVGAAAGAALVVTRLSPLEAMGPRDVIGEAAAPVRRRVLLAGAACVMAGIVLVVAGSAETQVLAALLVLNGIVVLVWALRAPLANLVGSAARRGGAAGLLVSLAVERSPARNVMTTLAALLPVAVVVGVGGLNSNIYRTAERDYSVFAEGDLYLTGLPFSEANDTMPLPAPVVEEVAALDEVDDIVPGGLQFLRIEGGEALVYGGGPGAHAPTLDVASPEAVEAVYTSDAAVVTGSFARRLSLSTGDTFPVATSQGDVEVRIAEIVEIMSWPGGFIAVSFENLVRWSGSDLVNIVDIDLAEGANVADVTASLGAIEERTGVEIFATDGGDAANEALLAVEQSQSLFAALQAVLMAAGAFAIVSTLTISTISRTRELGLLRAVGARRRLVRRSVVLEAFVVTLTGASLGAVVGVALQYVAVLVLGDATGFPADFAFTAQPLLVAAAAALAIAAAAALFTSRRAVGLDVLEAVSYE